MSRFQFAMQKILDVKEKSREQEEWNFARIHSSLEKEKSRLIELLEDKSNIQLSILDCQEKGAPIEDITRSQIYIEYLNERINKQQSNINELAQLLQAKQKELVTLKIDEEKWIRFKDKKYQEYLIESNRSEQKVLDEIASHLMFK